MKMILLSVYHLILLADKLMKIHVETRLPADYVQTLSTLIGQIIPNLTNDAESDIDVNLFCVAKFHVKPCFRFAYVLYTKRQTFRKYE